MNAVGDIRLIEPDHPNGVCPVPDRRLDATTAAATYAAASLDGDLEHAGTTDLDIGDPDDAGTILIAKR